MVLRRLFGKPSGASPAPSSTVAAVLPADAQQRLSLRVSDSERLHCGEIRLCIEAAMPPSYTERNAPPRERALSLFGKLRVWDTEANNGVLIYLLLAERAIEVVADRGVARLVEADHWQSIVADMQVEFRQRHFEAGLLKAVDAVDTLLMRHFALPERTDNPDELPNRPQLL